MNITLTMPATLDIKGTSKAFLGPGRSPAALPVLPVSKPPEPDHGPYIADYQLFKTDNRPFEGYAYTIVNSNGRLLQQGDTGKTGETKIVNSEKAIDLKARKSIMRETERITENWQSVLDAKAKEAEVRSNTPGNASEGETR
jgi:type VI secretion system secreted protein VgrG